MPTLRIPSRLSLLQVVGAVIATVGSQLSGRLFENLLGLADQRNKLGLVTGIAPMNFIVKDHSRVVLDQLQGATKLHGLIELALHNSPSMGIEKRNNALREYVSRQVCPGSAQQASAVSSMVSLNFCLSWAGRRCRQLLESLTALGQRVGQPVGLLS